MMMVPDLFFRTLTKNREGSWDKAARDPNDEMVHAGLTPDNIRKWEYLKGIQGQNETLFYRVLLDNFAEMASVVYTPTVGWACLNLSRMFRIARGMYFSAKDRGHMVSIAYNWPSHEVDAIVVMGGSRILGLGDVGMNGMGISIGKLDLYVAAAGFHPARVLPCLIDLGTNSKKLLADDRLQRSAKAYLGLNQERPDGDEYLQVVDEFVAAVKARWPKALIQVEDFRTEYASKLLERYRYKHLCFNDDVQFRFCSRSCCWWQGANFWVMNADGLVTEARSSTVEKATRRFARPTGGRELKDGSNVEQASSYVEIS
ncbi:unnamed protein product [Ectocarpus sp. CCAP 1310/34]|nr:unnamed protein product [Ectocarpus sp. CCAP 1310/34]